MPRKKSNRNGVPVPAGENRLYLDEAATLCRCTVDALVMRIRREQVPPACILRPAGSRRILIDRAKLEKLYLKPRGRRC